MLGQIQGKTLHSGDVWSTFHKLEIKICKITKKKKTWTYLENVLNQPANFNNSTD